MRPGRSALAAAQRSPVRHSRWSGSGHRSTTGRWWRGHGCTRSTADVTEVGIGYVVTLINTATLDQLYLDYV